MAEETTTPVPDDAGAAIATEPAAPVEPVAATTPPEPTEPAEPSTDENLDWLKKKGIDPTSPEAVSKVAEMYRNAEKAMHQSTAQASELKKSLSTPDPTAPVATDVEGLTNKVAALERTIEVTTFMADPEHKAMESKMAEMVTADPTLKALVNQGYMSVESLYYMAKGSDVSREAQLKADGGKEALERVAKNQQAKAVPGVATTSAMSNNEPEDAFLKGLTSKS